MNNMPKTLLNRTSQRNPTAQEGVAIISTAPATAPQPSITLSHTSIARLTAAITSCRRCERLVAHREAIAANAKKPKFADWDYWAKPVPGFGNPEARLLIVGLAPAAHGGNRTGRVFTGDPSATFLMRAMHAAGYANQPNSDHRDDGLRLHGAYIAAAVRCVPPGDKPTPAEQRACLPYLVNEMALLPNLRAVLALGHIAFNALLAALSARAGRKLTAEFSHGARYDLGPGLPALYACYHPSPRNTNTGRLSQGETVGVFRRIQQETTESRNV
jgi:uracil-DNA glycosylase family 4